MTPVKSPAKRNTRPSPLEIAGKVRGVYSAVARSTGRSYTHVREVALGNRQSPEIEAELKAELKRRGVAA